MTESAIKSGGNLLSLVTRLYGVSEIKGWKPEVDELHCPLRVLGRLRLWISLDLRVVQGGCAWCKPHYCAPRVTGRSNKALSKTVQTEWARLPEGE
jgi:hypothetical protein